MVLVREACLKPNTHVRRPAFGRDGLVDAPGEAIEEEVAALERLSDGLCAAVPATERLKALHRAAHHVKGLGGASEHPLLAAAAASLCGLLEKLLDDRRCVRVSPLREAAIAMHVRKLRQILDRRLTDAGDEAGAKLISGLRAVAVKASG